MSRLSYREAPAQSNYDVVLNGLSLDDVKPTTALVTAHHHFKGTHTKPLVPPISISSTYIVEKMEDVMGGIADGGPIYSRLGNPLTETIEATINAVEKGAGTLTFSSGMAAVTAVLTCFLKSGDHVILPVPCYPGTMSALKHLTDHFGVEFTKLNNDVTVENVDKVTKPNTKLIWVESPCNPELVVVDIEALGQYCKTKGILLGVDGTFASPMLQHVMPYGVDFAMHSCTKYMGGHSDLIAGCVTTKTLEQWRALKHFQTIWGNMLSPHDGSLLLRGLKTLPLRMERVSNTALKVASYLEQHPKVLRVLYPGLPSHPQYEIAKRQMPNGCGGMIMAEIKGGNYGGRTVAENVRVIRLCVSLGGVESILEHPYSMTHGPYILSPEEMEESRVTPGMLRISLGVEDPEDLIKDFEQALNKVDLDSEAAKEN